MRIAVSVRSRELYLRTVASDVHVYVAFSVYFDLLSKSAVISVNRAASSRRSAVHFNRYAVQNGQYLAVFLITAFVYERADAGIFHTGLFVLGEFAGSPVAVFMFIVSVVGEKRRS